MSKRARITLEPAVDSKPDQDTEATPQPKTEPDARDDFIPAADKSTGTSVASRWAAVLNTGNLVKVVVVGLAAASIVLLWKNRRL
ncbi:MAG: hypothetical protein WBP44_00390 [Gammaproteobacteria bacterium]